MILLLLLSLLYMPLQGMYNKIRKLFSDLAKYLCVKQISTKSLEEQAYVFFSILNQKLSSMPLHSVQR